MALRSEWQFSISLVTLFTIKKRHFDLTNICIIILSSNLIPFS